MDTVNTIGSGIGALDIALGGGFAAGRIVEMYGPEGAGKRGLALRTIAAAQRAGRIVAYLDSEGELDLVAAQACGVQTDRLLVSQPDTCAEGLSILETLARSGAVDLIVVDSISTLAVADDDDEIPGETSRRVMRALRTLAGIVGRTGTCVLVLSHLRIRQGAAFGVPETTAGSNALKFYASQRLDVRRVGTAVKATIVKNKIPAPFKRVWIFH